MTAFSGAHAVYDELTADQLKERLMVAETIMKRLYNRNKELETYHTEHAKKADENQPPLPSEELSKLLGEFRNRESDLEGEIRSKEECIKRLERENQRLI